MKKLLNKINFFNKIETIISKNKGFLYFGLKLKILILVLLLSQVNESFAQACYTPHSSSPQYCAGAQVSYNGNNYVNCFCVQGGVPSNSSAPGCSGYGAYWRLVGACSNCTNRTVGAASSSPTVCINTAMTSITHSTTQVTAVGTVAGLPAGVTAAYSGNVITISGTPTASGVFNYTITPTSGCGSATATGTITVTALPTITGTTPASVCGSGTLALSATASAGTISWWAASTGGTALATGTSYTTPNISTTTTYYVSAASGTCTSASRTAIAATVTNTLPTITGTTPASRCGAGTVALSATASAGTISWWAASTGGVALATGTSYTTPSISSTTTYYVSTTSGTCTSASRTAITATVTAAATAGAASSTPTLCVNSALTNITHTTTVATGIGTATGLPAGVTAAWASNTITISGTPTASGTFNYTIPLTVGSCVVNATGTITVTSTAWAPTDLGASLAMWYDASDASSITHSSGAVSQWNDKSGNARHLAESNNTYKPTYTANILNGYGGINFYLNKGLFSTANPVVGYVATIIKAQNTTWNNYHVMLESRTNATRIGGLWANGSNTFWSDVFPSLAWQDGTSMSVSGAFSTINTPHIIEYTPSAGRGNPMSGVTVGNYDQQNSGGSGIQYEIIALSAAPSQADRERIEGYLAWKWGLQANLPAGHTYKSAAPTIVATAGAASSTPTLCQNTALTNITHTTTVATGIGTATGLPAGVTAAWASNTITISGTPSASGTFNYTIPLTIGCGTVNATGTITVRSSSGPGGVTDQLSVWLKADAGVSSIGTSWQDQGCNARNYTTVSGPTVISNDINFNPAIEILSGGFDGPAGAAIGTSWTLFSVHRLLPSDANGRLIDGATGNNLLGNQGVYSNGIYLNGNPAEYEAGIATTTNTQTQTLYCYSRDNATGNIIVRVNGDLLKTFTSTNTASGIIWDLNQGAYAGESSDARMGEFIVFNKALSATEILKVEAYLATKYAIVLSNADGGTGGDFVSTGGTTYWDASASTAYSNEIVVLGKDANTGLTQKQSKSSDDSLRVYVGSFAAANTSNAGTITNDQSFLVLGHNNGKLKANYLSSLEKPSGITSRFQREWKVVNTNFTDNFTLRVQYDSSTAITLSHLRLLVDDDGNFSNATAYGTADGLTFSHGSIIVSGISTSMIPSGSTKYITIGSTSTSTTLPVNLLSFDAVLQDGFVELSWETASEINNDHFVVERSNDGVNWTSFAKVKGAGNSNSTLSYFQADVANFTGVRYYRLTQVDFDGTKETFKAIDVSKIATAPFEIKVFPNPMNEEVKVSFFADKQGYSRFRIYAESGQEMYGGLVGTVQGENSFNFNTSSFTEGIYVFKIEKENGVVSTVKVVK